MQELQKRTCRNVGKIYSYFLQNDKKSLSSKNC